MPRCLYCQHDNLPQTSDCSDCGMPLPVDAEISGVRRQRRFLWFCIGLGVFCAMMIIWLPRSMP